MRSKIVIFSENRDQSTINVMRWCKLAGCKVYRINKDDNNLTICISDKQVNISTSFDSFSIDKDTICWFRRAEYPFVYIITDDTPMKKEFGLFNFLERQETFNALKFWIKQNCTYSSHSTSTTFNKVGALLKANVCGIKVPGWIVTGEKQQALLFFQKYNEVASKSFNGFSFTDEELNYKMLTQKMDISELNTYPEQFVPRFFQQYIEKKYELRSFYFHGRFFTYAILSQNNPKTAVDFRNYDDNNPNRSIPFNLPKDYEAKLKTLMALLKLDTGSFDILVDNSDEYYFLEVNPVGQFGIGSYQCNQNVEKYIVDYLIKIRS